MIAETPVHRIRTKVIDSLQNTPDFVCSETIDLTESAAGKGLVRRPSLHVEAGVINGKELYAWPGDEDERTHLREVLAIFAKGGSGSFALYSRAVFITTDASFYGLTNDSPGGVSLSRTDFAMPQAASTYALMAGGKPVTLGYTGSIWLEPASLQLVRLALRADDPPADSDVKAVSQILEFGEAKFLLNPNTVLMPVSTEFDLQERSGRKVKLAGHFTDCRSYAGKHGELFVETAMGPPAEVAAKPAAPAAPTARVVMVPAAVPAVHIEGPLLPAKLNIETVLADAIDERTTVQGSKLTFTVIRDVKYKGKTIVPKGSTIAGRVTRVLRQAYPIEVSEGLKAYYLVGIRLDGVSTGGNESPLVANLESLGPWPDSRTNSVYFIPYSHDPNRWGTYDEWKTVFIVPKPDPGESFLGVIGEFLRLHGDFVMYWTTADPPR